MDLNLDGNAALVAASSSGLGKASATALAREGADVVINGRNEDRLEQAVTELEDVGSGRVIGQAGDITQSADVTELVSRTVEEFGRLDHLVTNAGETPWRSFIESDDQEWYEAFDLLVMSVVRLVRDAAPHLEDNGGGTIVSITSRSVKEAISRTVLSNAVRSSVIGLEKTLSREMAPAIRANAVLPGAYATPRIKEVFAAEAERGVYDSPEEALAARTARIPLERIGEPMELGDLVAFLSSPRSGFINGAAIVTDGGESKSNL